MESLSLILAVILFILGLAGTVLPVLPGGILIYAGMLLYGLLTRFASLDLGFFLIQAAMLVIVFLVDNLASAVGTRHFGGSKQASWGAIIGTVFGLFLGPIGIVVAPFLGAVTAELIQGISPKQAVRSGIGTLVGILGGVILQLAIEIMMIIYFFINI